MAAPDPTIPQSAIKDAVHASAATEPSSAVDAEKPEVPTVPVEMSQFAASRPDLDSFITPPSSIPVSPMEGTFTKSQVGSEGEKSEVSPLSDSSNKHGTIPAAAATSTTTAAQTPGPDLENQTAAAPALTRTETTPAIGPAAESDAEAAAALAPAEAAALAIPITLLLTTGARHPFRLDAKYLAKRNVSAQDNDPLNISVYTMKELIWRDWRVEWEARPTSPSSIRLITFGRLLDDKITLRDCKLSPDQPNVVHMTVKPADMEDDGGLTKGGRGEGEGASPGCKCCVVM